MKRYLVIVITLYVLLIPETPAWASSETVHIGILAIRPKAQMQQNWQPLAGYLGRRLPGYRIQLHLLDHREMLTAIKQQTLDFALTNPSHYILLRHETGGLTSLLATLLPLPHEGARPLRSFGGVIFTRSDRDDISSLDDLKDKKIACVVNSVDTLGGFQMQAFELQQQRIMLEPTQLMTTGLPQDRAVKAVLEGRADVGFVRTGLIELFEREGTIPPGSLKIINRQNLPGFPFASSTRLYPEWPFVAFPHVDIRLAARMAAALLSIEPGTAALDAAGIYGFSAPASYQPVEELLRELRHPPFDTEPSFSMYDVWKRYRPWIVCLALVIAVGLQRHFRQMASKRRLKEALSVLEQKQLELTETTEAKEAAHRAQRLLSASNRALLHIRDEAEQLFQVCRIAVEIGGYSSAWVGLAAHDAEKSVLPAAWFGIDEELLKQTRMTWSEGERGASAMAAAIRTATIQIRRDILNDPSLAPWHENARRLNHGAAVALPLVPGDELYGALTIYASEPNAFQPGEVELLDELARDLAFGIQTLRERKAHEEMREHVHQLAYYDRLTGLPNRTLFQDRMHQAVLDASQHAHILGIMLLDLDSFKEVNDTLGHKTGDELLREAAARFIRALRPQDTVARLGGDEFAILIPEVRREVDLAIVAKKLISSLKEPFSLQQRELFVTASIGIAGFPSDSAEASDLLRYADAAMYHAKASGKNCFQFYSNSLTRAATERMELESDLRKALANGELEVYYQPKIHTLIGRMTGAEALLRWHHPTRGMIPPDQFIGIAEDTGLIIEIGAWVVRTACSVATAWNKGSLFPVKVAVNLSARQLMHGDFVDMVRTALSNSGCRPEWLELEITESLLMARTPEVVSSLEALDKQGISIAIDDFGTGYSSLSYLTDFPIRTIKIDKAFVKDITTDKRRLELVRAIVSLGHSLSAELVAEGVETDEQAACLDRLGCHLIQGYLYGKPMPIAAFNAWHDHFSATRRSNGDGMARIIASAWRDYLTTGQPVIDAQHQELFRQITELTTACRRHEQQHNLPAMLDYLGNYVKVHFATEEKLLRDSGSPDYLIHKAAHDYFADLVHTLIAQCRTEGESRDLTIKTNFLAVEWLTRHICIMDRKLADELHDKDTEKNGHSDADISTTTARHDGDGSP